MGGCGRESVPGASGCGKLDSLPGFFEKMEAVFLQDLFNVNQGSFPDLERSPSTIHIKVGWEQEPGMEAPTQSN